MWWYCLENVHKDTEHTEAVTIRLKYYNTHKIKERERERDKKIRGLFAQISVCFMCVWITNKYTKKQTYKQRKMNGWFELVEWMNSKKNTLLCVQLSIDNNLYIYCSDSHLWTWFRLSVIRWWIWS